MLSLVAKVWKQLMLLEAERKSLQEDLDVSREEAQKHVKEIQALQARLKDNVTFEEHFNITGKLRRYHYCVLFFNHMFLCL